MLFRSKSTFYCILPSTIYSGSRKSCQILIENLSTILKTIKSGFITQIEYKNQGAQSGCCTKHNNEGCMQPETT